MYTSKRYSRSYLHSKKKLMVIINNTHDLMPLQLQTTKISCQRESNNASNQKSSFAKVVQLGLAIAERRSEVVDIQSFGHKS